MDTLFTDGFGTYWDGSGNRYDVYDLIMAGINVAGATLSDSPYYAENDPRFKQGRYPTNNYPGYGLPNQTRTGSGDYIPGAVNDRGFQLNWWTAALIGVVVGSFLLGKRGR